MALDVGIPLDLSLRKVKGGIKSRAGTVKTKRKMVTWAVRSHLRKTSKGASDYKACQPYRCV